jgi:hypothetical protein
MLARMSASCLLIGLQRGLRYHNAIVLAISR